MIILSVSPRRKHLVCVKFEDGERLIDTDIAQYYGLRAGMELDDETLSEISYRSELERAKNRALWLMSVRDYSARDMAAKLYRDFERDAADEAVCMLIESGVLDDRRFAAVYAQELGEVRRMSRQNIRRELINKGIDREIISEITDTLPEDEVPQITEQIKLRYSNCFDDEKSYRRMFNALLRRGYSFEDIKRAVNEYAENERD